MRTRVTVYSRLGCHLCEVAVRTLELLQNEMEFDIEERIIDGDLELESAYGEQVPVIHIDGEHHDFFSVDPERFRSSLEKRRLHQ